MQRSLIASTALLLLAGCATAPKPLAGDYVQATPHSGTAEGERVRWGGAILSVEPKPDLTCFQVLAHELDASARPRRSDQSAGRFVACRSGFYDPAVFSEGREITVVGAVSGSETRRIGEYDYRLPRVLADVVYLWPERLYADAYAVRPYLNWWPYSYGPPFISYHYHHSHHRH